MSGKNTVLSVPVQLDTGMFRDFALFDVLQRQKRWKRPLLFAVLMLAFAAICFSQVGVREGAALLGGVLTAVALGLPLVYFGMFFRSVSLQAKKMGLSTPKSVYRVELGPDGVGMWPAGQQDKAQPAASHDWESVYGAWRTAQAVYLYINATQAYLLPAEEIPGGVDAAWTLLGEHLPAEKLHVTR